MNDDRELDRILSAQKIPPSATNLSARIIAAAQAKPSQPFWMVVMQEISAMFILPRPAYAMAFSLIFGLVLGLQGEMSQFEGTEDWLSFMDVSGYITEENWL